MKTLVIMLVLLLSVVAVNAQKVKVEADRNTDLSKYKTYAWEQGTMVSNPIINQQIISAVDQALAAKGLKRVEANPELLVVSLAAVNSDVQTAYPSSNNSMGSAPSTGIAVGSQAWIVSKGTLIIDISDAGTKNRLWRGTATDTLGNGPTGDLRKDAKTVEKPIKKAVEKMFKQYPRPS